jgi:hypothetical protein
MVAYIFPNAAECALIHMAGAYSVGTPDCVSHIAEEIPRPEVNVPKAIAAQMGIFPFLMPFLLFIKEHG